MPVCPGCNSEFDMPSGRGKARKYCTAECGQAQWLAMRKTKLREPCSVPGCGAPATRVKSQMCEKHYGRIRRQGTVEYVGGAKPGDRMHSGGYVLIPAKGHPRANGGYRAYAHRVAFTDANGEGPFACHWCSKEVTWANMHVDHLDDDKQNNDPKNLVASCPVCNQQRGHEKKMQAHREKTGIEFRGEKLTPNEWASRIGISRSALMFRLENGWPLERALTEGRGVTGPKDTRW